MPQRADKVWSYKTGDKIDSSPTVADGVVYVGSCDNNVYALDAATGNKIWSYTTGSPVESFPSVANGVLYIGSDDNNVYAFGSITVPQPSQTAPNPSLSNIPSPSKPSASTIDIGLLSIIIGVIITLTIGLVFGLRIKSKHSKLNQNQNVRTSVPKIKGREKQQ